MECMMSSYDLLHILRNEQKIRFAWKCFLSQYDAAVSQWFVNKIIRHDYVTPMTSVVMPKMFFLFFLLFYASMQIFIYLYIFIQIRFSAQRAII